MKVIRLKELISIDATNLLYDVNQTIGESNMYYNIYFALKAKIYACKLVLRDYCISNELNLRILRTENPENRETRETKIRETVSTFNLSRLIFSCSCLIDY